MDIRVVLLISFLTVAATLAVAARVDAWRDRRKFWEISRNALAVPANRLLGATGVLAYLVIYFVLGNRIHFFYGRLIFTVSASETILAIFSALLVGWVFALFPYSLKQLGLIKPGQGGWGVAGTLLAVLVSFCP